MPKSPHRTPFHSAVILPRRRLQFDQATRNVQDALRLHVPTRIADILGRIASVAQSQGTKAWLVGGFVRDALLGIPTRDQVPDITILGPVAPFAEACVRQLPDSRIEAQSAFQTCRMLLDGQTVELASARTDTYEPHGALPRVSLVDSICDDLQRRDFTTNAMAVELMPDGYGRLCDPFGGSADCANRILRVLHSESFQEDPTRILRGIRLAARHNLQFDPATTALIRHALPDLANFMVNSPERLSAELTHWFNANESLANIVKIASDLGVTSALGITIADDNDVNKLDLLPDSWDADARFATFLQILPPNALNAFSQNVPLTKDWRKLADDTAKLRRTLTDDELLRRKDSEVANKLRNVGKQVVAAAALISQDPKLIDRLTRLNAARHVRPHLNGHDLQDMGIRPGRAIGEMLDELTNKRIDGALETRQDEVTYVRKLIDQRDAESN